ncbi:MAG: flagellar basal body P-ring formation chaperone FlgA, partial [Bryobacteraceae bacterium]
APEGVALVANLEGAVGLIPRRRIAAGQPVAEAALSRPLDVARGDEVTVEVRNGRAQLEFRATAESAGRAGDLISLKNPSSGKRFRGRVAGKGRVVVEGERSS